MLSLLTSRVAFRLPHSLSSATFGRAGVVPVTPRVILLSQTRFFLATTRLELPTKAATTKTKTSVSHQLNAAAAKRHASKKPAVKQRVAAKKKPSPKKKHKKVAKPKRLVITRDMKPPRRSSTVYIHFFKDFIEKHGKVSSLAEMAGVSKEASNAWKGLTQSARQPFYAMAAADRDEYLKKRDEYFKHVDPAVLRELNKRNAVKGKHRIVRPRTDSDVRVPLNGYMRFVKDFRQTAEGQELSSSSDQPATKVARRAGEVWRTMSDAEKEPYNKDALAARKAYQASHSA